MISRTVRSGLSWLALLACALPGTAQPVEVSYEQIWGKESALPLVPLRVTLKNPGDARQVNLTLEDGHGVQRTPVDLPPGSQKELEYIVRPSMGPARLLLQEGFSTRLVTIEVGFNANAAGTLAVISDTPGDFSSVRSGRLRPTDVQSRDFYAAPGRAPTRMAAYARIAAIILAEGAERMTDAEVKAVQQAVLAGTLLVVPVGAPKPILSDPRWQGWWPARVTGSRNVTDLSAFARDGTPPAGPLTLATAEPLADAAFQSSEGAMLTASHSVGLGRVLLLGYDPGVGALRRWDPLGRHLNRVLISERNAVASAVWDGPGRTLTADPYASGGGQESGLQLEAPSAGFVWISFALFLILIGPVQFLVLRRLDKGEMAWIITPALSVAFAMGLVIVGQRGLARFQQRETIAVLAVNPAGNLAAGAASQTFFLPEAGGYDLRVRPTDVIGFERLAFGGSDAALPYQREVADDGVMALPSLRVNSLAFVPINLLGEFAAPTRMEGAVRVAGTSGRTQIEGSVTNRGQADWEGATLMVGAAPIPWMKSLGNANWGGSFDRFRRVAATTKSLWNSAGGVPAGATEKISATLELETVRAIAEGAPVWLVAQTSDEGIGSPVGRSADSSSVNVYRVMPVANRAMAREVAAAIPEPVAPGRRP